jgi:flagellar protein FlbD
LNTVADNGFEGDRAMIELTRLNGRPMVVNSDLIKTAEASPDTMLTLINGEKLIVREEIAEVVERILVYRARLLAVVARRLHHFGDLERAAALVSLDATGAPDDAPQQPKRDGDAGK